MPIVTSKGLAAPQAPIQHVQVPKTEPIRQPDTVVDAPAPKEEALSPKFAALAKRERQLRALDQQIKERESKLAEREKSYETTHIPKERLTKETLKVLREAGLTDEALATMLLNGNQPGDQSAFIQEEIDKVRAELKASTEKTQSDLEARDKKAREQAVAQIRTQAQTLVDSSPEFETIKETGSTEAIVKFIESTFDEEGVLMDVEEAAKFIENELIEEAMKTMKLKKIQEKVRAEFAPAVTKPTLKQPQMGMKTLTNQTASSTSGGVSAKDRYHRAVMRARGLDPDAVG